MLTVKRGAAAALLMLTLLLCIAVYGQPQSQSEAAKTPASKQESNTPAKRARLKRLRTVKRHVTRPVKKAVHRVVAFVSAEGGTGEEDTATDVFSIRQLGKAVQLPSSKSTLAFGPIQLSEFDLLGMYRASSAEGNSGTRVKNAAAGILRSNFVYETKISHGRFALQYSPQIIAYGGRVQVDALSQNLNFDLGLALGGRWMLYVRDRVGYHGANSLLDEFYSADALSGSAVQNRFLQTNGNFVSNRLELSLERRLSVQTMIRLTPFYQYQYAGGFEASSPGDIPMDADTSHEVGLAAEVSHALTSRTHIGLKYSAEMLRLSWQAGGFGPASHSAGISFGHQLTPSWQLTATTGVGLAGGQSSRYVTMTGDATVVKSFRRSFLAFSYFRGQSSGGYITSNEFSDRADMGYHFPVGRKLTFGLGGGYFRGSTSDAKNVTGKYAAYTVTYPLFAHLESRLSYSYRWQNGNDPQLLHGSRQFLTAGVRWSFTQRGRR